MYFTLLSVHSFFRWLVLISLLYAIFRAFRGYRLQLPFSHTDNRIRHWTATIAHVQLMLGVTLYFKSPLTSLIMKQTSQALQNTEVTFFGLIHVLLMVIAIVILTIGSAKAKRKTKDREKFRTMLIYFFPALVIILIAIPWPFSTLAARPYLPGV